eukprot:1925410-Rhodomonas_salina.2
MSVPDIAKGDLTIRDGSTRHRVWRSIGHGEIKCNEAQSPYSLYGESGGMGLIPRVDVDDDKVGHNRPLVAAYALSVPHYAGYNGSSMRMSVPHYYAVVQWHITCFCTASASSQSIPDARNQRQYSAVLVVVTATRRAFAIDFAPGCWSSPDG